MQCVGSIFVESKMPPLLQIKMRVQGRVVGRAGGEGTSAGQGCSDPQSTLRTTQVLHQDIFIHKMFVSHLDATHNSIGTYLVEQKI